MSDELLKWIAEELLGWKYIPEATVNCCWKDRLGNPKWIEDLPGWPGIGLVIAEMERRGFEWEMSRTFVTASPTYGCRFYLPNRTNHVAFPWVYAVESHDAVFAAARKSVEAGDA
jgi:hypothetical protein